VILATVSARTEGIRFRFAVVDQDGAPIDVSTVSGLKLLLRPPIGARTTRAVGFEDDGSNGLVTYTSELTDFNVVGPTGLQLYFQTAAGEERYSDVMTVIVEAAVGDV
jgi:hypothetical protein